MASGLQAHHVYTGLTDAKKPQFRLPIFPCILQKQPHSGLISLILHMRVILRLLMSLNTMAYSQIYHTKAIKRQTPAQKVVFIFFISFTIFPQIFIGFGQ